MKASGWCLAITGVALLLLSLFTVRVRAETFADGRSLVRLDAEERVLDRRRAHALVKYTASRHLIAATSARAQSASPRPPTTDPLVALNLRDDAPEMGSVRP